MPDHGLARDIDMLTSEASQHAQEQAQISRAEKNRALIRLVQEQPGRGTAELFELYAPLVNRWVRRLMGSDAEHDDVVQAIFCVVIAKIYKVREPGKLDSWIRAVTVNTVLQELRKRRFRHTLMQRLPFKEMTRSLVQDVETRDLLKRAQAILDCMPRRERVVFLLHHAESHTLNEVAEICNFSVATAKRRLSKANSRFKRLVAHDTELERLVSELLADEPRKGGQ